MYPLSSLPIFVSVVFFTFVLIVYHAFVVIYLPT